MKKMYWLVVTDDYSRFSWVFFLATKEETSEILKTFITGIENLIDLKMKVIRCNNGPEFKNKVMKQLCKSIKREFSIARTPQQNRVAERKNRTLIEAARTMLADSNLPTTFWAEVVNTACYVQNRVLVIKPYNKTPHELFLSRKPVLSFMRPFRCPVTILNTLVPTISDSEDESETKIKSKQRKPSFAKTEFVKSNELVKTTRESVKKVENKKQAKYSRKNSQSLRAAVSVNNARPINTVYPRPTVNSARTASNIFNTAHTHVRRPFNKSTINKNSNLKEKVNTVKGNVTTVGPKALVSDNKGYEANLVKASACWVSKPKQKVLDHSNPQLELQEKGVIDSGCFRHITGNKSYLLDYGKIDGEFVAFGGDPKGGRITGKSTISIDTECVVLSPDFKLLDENHVLLRVPRKDNMYSVDLKNIVPSGGVAYQKGKQHKTSCKTKTVSSISQPLQMLHMDLFGPTSVKSLMKKMYCLVVTDDYSRFSWVFFLATKDETSEILKTFITGIENLIDLMVKAQVVNTAYYIQNRVLVIKTYNKTPHELFLSRKPALSFMRPFGCLVTIHNTIDHLGKFYGKANEGFFVGYSTNSKAYRVFNNRTRIVEENLHVKFSKETPNITGNGPNWLFDIDALTISMNYKPVVAGNQTNGNAGTKENIDARQDGKKIVHDQKYILLPLLTSDPSLSKRSKDSLDVRFKPLGEEEKIEFEHLENENSEVPNTEEPKVNQEQDSNINSTNKINTFCPTVNAADIENNVVDENIVYGCIDDPNMPNFEEIIYSDDDEEVGAEADMNNLATTMPVSPIPTTRVHKDHPLEQIIRDIHLTPQTRRMTKNVTEHIEPKKKVWTLVELPYGKRAIVTKWVYRNNKDDRGIMVRNKARLVAQGYTQEEGIDYDEFFAQVARIEAIRLFLAYASFMNFIVYHMDVKSAFLYGTIEEEVEKALYGLHQASRSWYETLSTYLLENGFRRGTIDKTLFIKKDKGDILLVQVKQKDDGIFISQDKYMADILKKFDFATVKTASTPMETNKALLKDEEAVDVDVHLYRSMIGSLMYLTASRPDIIYLKGHPKLGLWYPRDSPFDLEAFSDSYYAVANSTTEAEYVTAATCYGQVLWIQNQLLDYGYNFMTTKIFIDNESTIYIVKNPVFHSKTKHIKIRHHFISDSYEKRLIQVIKIHTDHNVADLLIKAFDTVIKEWEDRIERAATTASSLEAEQDSMEFLSIPYCNALVLRLQPGMNLVALWHLLSSVLLQTKILTFPSTFLINDDEELGVEGSKHKGIYVIPSHTKKIFANMKREGKGFSGKITPLFQTMMVQAPEDMGEDSAAPIDSHSTPIFTQPPSSKPKNKKSRRKQRKDSGPIEPIPDEATNEEPISTPSCDPPQSGEDRLQLAKLMTLCTKPKKQVLDLEEAKIAQAKEISRLKKIVKQLENRRKSRTSRLKRLRKVGSASRVESSNDVSLDAQEDVSKQGRKIADLDADAEVTLIDETQERYDEEMLFDVQDDLQGEEVVAEKEVAKKEVSVADPVTTVGEVVTTASATTTVDELNLAQTLIEIKAAKPKAVTTAAITITTGVASTRPKAKGIVFHDQEEQAYAFTPIVSSS
ncbi:putative ribonuclease H-like domain-containing protein [Tanacetum coccineum]